ncbi:hypothetical protein LCGC14_0901160 [marine sediment metagenome]|uniref:Uncharacterized protein n=1 Tax=marine sediment metagenome TaxID=412755 RepID=A0A0F9P1C3_9ZZZZ|nr:MAG: hypothetical protein Lokiarch_27930 [Candidatus Lokiarchaeum sp. GC14_75]
MVVRCRVCATDRKKRKVVKRMPVKENELPEKFSEYQEFICMNIIKELRKDKKWHDAVCENRSLVLRKRPSDT